jgi:hypothetical protein
MAAGDARHKSSCFVNFPNLSSIDQLLESRAQHDREAVARRVSDGVPRADINRIATGVFMTRASTTSWRPQHLASGNGSSRSATRVRTDKTETNINLLAIRRVHLRIDRELREQRANQAP